MDRNEKLEKALALHKKNAPGIYLGVLMLEEVEKVFEIKEKANFAVETTFCLPDVIQSLYGATLGNRYLRLEVDSGRYACTVFDRDTGEGIRVFIDARKIVKEEMPYFWEFYFRERDLTNISRKEHNKKVIAEILEKGKSIIGLAKVKVNLPPKEPLKETAICQKCGEAFLKDAKEQNICLECQKEKSYYEIVERM